MIPFDKFGDIEYIAEGGFAKVYSATWIDGEIEKWDQASNDWKRSGSKKIALKILNNSKNIRRLFK
jgi:peptidyl-tRNA hydrolase